MSRLLFILLFLPAIACSSESAAPAVSDPITPEFTPASGSTSTLLGRRTFTNVGPTLKIKRTSGDWDVEVKAKPELDVAVQRIKFEPGGHSGWHTHPGPVFIQVVYWTMRFYESDDPSCTAIIRDAASPAGYLDLGEHAHIARNETADSAVNIVTYLAPPGVPLRNDVTPAPGNCPF